MAAYTNLGEKVMKLKQHSCGEKCHIIGEKPWIDFSIQPCSCELILQWKSSLISGKNTW